MAKNSALEPESLVISKSKGRAPPLVSNVPIQGPWRTCEKLNCHTIRSAAIASRLISNFLISGKWSRMELEQKYRIRATGIDLEELLTKVALYYEIDPENLKTASKESTITKARSLFCYLAVRKLMISCADIARALNISPATVSRATRRGAKLSNLEKMQKKLLSF